MKSMSTKRSQYRSFLACLLLACLNAGPTFAWDDGDEAADGSTEIVEAAVAATSTDYTINPGDIIQVSVWREADLRADVLIRPDGKFSFPLAGDIQAQGNTVEQVRERITEKLNRFIPDPVVSVSVLAINGNKIYVIGQVGRAGDINANPQLDVLQALSIAGGMTPFAQVNDISILRRTGNGLVSIPFRYGDMEKGKRLEQNILLQAGDVIVVP